MIKLILIALILASSFPAGYLLAYLTRDEKKIYEFYFRPLLWILAVLAAIFYTLNIIIALTLTFMFLAVFTWMRKNKA